MIQKRILFIVDHYFPHIGGAEMISQKVAEHLARHGWQVTVLTSVESGRPTEAIINDVKVVSAGKNRYLFTLYAMPKAWRLARDCDMIQAATYNAGPIAWIVGRSRGKPVFLIVYELLNRLWFKTMNPFSAFLHWFFECFLIFLPFDRYVAISEFTKGQLLAKKIPETKINVISPGVEHFKTEKTDADLRRKLRYGDQDFIVLFFGRPGILKGAEDLVVAMKQLKNPRVKLLMILSREPHPGRKKIEQMVKGNLSIRIIDSINREQLAFYLAMADAVVIPSLQEGFGFSATEACHMGRPVIVSRAGALPETVFGKVIWVEPGNPQSLVEGIRKAVAEEWESIPVKHFPWDEALKKYDQLYSGIQLQTPNSRLQTKKRIAIIADPIDEQYAGIHYYTKNLVENLLKIDQTNEYVLIHCRHNNVFREWIRNRTASTKEIVIPGWRRLPGWPTLRKFLLLSFVFWKHKPDVIFEPAHIGPFSFFWKCKKVVTINDLTPILFPEHHIWISRFIHKKLLPFIFKNVDGIITPSQSTKKDIQAHYQVQKPIKVIYDAANPDFRPANLDDIQKVQKKYGISKPYILSVGTLEPRKNLEGLMAVFQEIKEEGQDLQCVVVGKKGWYYQDFVKKLKDPAMEKDIIVTDYIDQKDLVNLYSGALVMVYPSLYEGFGLPPLEAMQCGCPVICSNTSSLPEVVGDAGILIDPKDQEALKSALKKVLTDERIRSEMREKGLARAAQFSWQKCAQETLHFLTHLQ